MEQIDVRVGEIGTKVLFETEHVKVWDLTLAPGEATDWHRHQMDYMFVVVKNGKVSTEYIDGRIDNQDDEIGVVDFRKKDIAHRLVNNDTKEYKNIVVEFKATFSED